MYQAAIILTHRATCCKGTRELLPGPCNSQARGKDPARCPLLLCPGCPSPSGAHLEEDEEGEPGCEDVPELDGVAVVVGIPVIPVPAAQPCWCQPGLPHARRA